MPLYEYKCPACGEEFEEITSASNEDPVECPQCGKKAERQISGFAIGSGGGGGAKTGSSCNWSGG